MSVLLLIDTITLDPRLQMRTELDPVDLQAYAKNYGDRGPTAMGAVEIYREERDGDAPVLRLTDGWTRLKAAGNAGCTEILADIIDGDFRAAFLAALRANGHRGGRLNRKALRRKAEAILTDPELSLLSVRAMEDIYDVGRDMIATVRDELVAAGKVAAPTTVIGRDGVEQAAKKRGRPPGSKNKPKTSDPAQAEGLAYIAEVRAEVKALLERLEAADVEGFDNEGTEEIVSLWLEGLASEPLDDLLVVRESLKRAVAALDTNRPAPTPAPTPERLPTRPVVDLLVYLRDAGVEHIEHDGGSWSVRGVLMRIEAGEVQRRELLQISQAAETAVAKLPPAASERRAESHEDGRRRGKLIARLKQLASDGVEVLGGAPVEYLRQVVPTMTEEQLVRVEGLAFPAPESQPQDDDAVGALAVGTADDVADALDELSDEGKASALREALQRIAELERELAATRTLAQGLSEVYGEIVRVCGLPLDDDSVTPDDVMDVINERFTRAAAMSSPPAADISGGEAWDRTDPKLLDPYADFIGLLPDIEIAAMAGVEEITVLSHRERNNIPARWRDGEEAPPTPAALEYMMIETSAGPWKAEVYQRLGDVVSLLLPAHITPTSDRAQLASKASVHGGRHLWDIPLGPPPGLETHPAWVKVPEILRPHAHLLGTVPDHEIAVKVGGPMTPTKVGTARKALGIPAFKAS